MDLNYIEDLIEREHINLIDTYLEDTEGVFVNYDKLNIILYDNKKIKNSYVKKEVFAEELGHYYGNYTYKFNSDPVLIEKQEYKAKKFSYNMLISYEKLKLAIKNRN